MSTSALTNNTRKSIDHQQLGMNYERYFGDATLQVNAYTGRRNVIQYLSIPKGIPPNERGGGVVQIDRKFYGGSARWMQPIESAPGDLMIITGVDFDQIEDSRHDYQNYSGNTLGVKGQLRRDEIDTARGSSRRSSTGPFTRPCAWITCWIASMSVR